jgi:ABC-2 type transport system ATP-binding protein
MEEAQELSHRVAIIDHGEIIALGTQAELTQMVGEHDTVLLSVPEPSPAVMEALCKVEGVDTCTKVDDEDGAIRLIAKNARHVLPDVIRVINDAGQSVQSLEVQEPTLEAVFLHLTGRALRD